MTNELVEYNEITNKIFMIRGKKVIFDSDLAMLYGVETRVLKQAVKRNIKRFPEDFMFILTNEEIKNLRSQFVTSSHGGTRYLPYAFTEQGVAMLSCVLKSEKAIKINIQIMRAFTRLREIITSNEEILNRIEELEKKYDRQFKLVFDVIAQLLNEENNDEPKNEIGFR